MKQGVALPFRVLGEDAVRFTGWQLGTPGQPLQVAEDILLDWDYARDLEICTEVELDISYASRDLEIAESALDIFVSVRVGTGAGNIPRRVETVATANLNVRTSRARLSAVIKGHSLSGRLRLEASMALAAAPADHGELSPVFAGARLWRTQKDILIEDGGAGRFPIESIDFSKLDFTRSIAEAPWFIHWRTSRFDADFGGAVRVYVNKSNDEVYQRVQDGDPATLQAILADVMSQMIEHAIRMDGFRAAATDCPAGSLGDQVSKWISLVFPDRSDASILAEIEANPGLFRATVLDAAFLEGGS